MQTGGRGYRISQGPHLQHQEFFFFKEKKQTKKNFYHQYFKYLLSPQSVTISTKALRYVKRHKACNQELKEEKGGGTI